MLTLFHPSYAHSAATSAAKKPAVVSGIVTWLAATGCMRRAEGDSGDDDSGEECDFHGRNHHLHIAPEFDAKVVQAAQGKDERDGEQLPVAHIEGAPRGSRQRDAKETCSSTGWKLARYTKKPVARAAIDPLFATHI